MVQQNINRLNAVHSILCKYLNNRYITSAKQRNIANSKHSNKHSQYYADLIECWNGSGLHFKFSDLVSKITAKYQQWECGRDVDTKGDIYFWYAYIKRSVGFTYINLNRFFLYFSPSWYVLFFFQNREPSFGNIHTRRHIRAKFGANQWRLIFGENVPQDQAKTLIS